ncbi:ribosomal protein S12 methylthiotransferase accessory factor [Actinokineospora alba]|uniref:Ribosomal protein S12 methylthiotransferase accessory factor n=1 Tax=Actinokineospora alba TaxID=504798 RepID=A0A1H0W6V6_9PSEU|nr:TOMM precursor leader peptide-binding protein [Actinokineospora alba]TDP70012.1 ribosomal protein S12 methylthiotransferase accessory factor [Actinokineospora alba]SDJ49934.1 ribosomal protein S12 methylthiotransferase accessory factor [Actinokineospora alba]SDP86469.1 ribosomal protein S12 methylthiotransferase accessory factor [Actinokineospora alba]
MTTDGAKGPLVAFKRHLRAEIAAGEGVYLFSEDGVTVLKGSAIESVVSLMDGTRDLPGVLGELPDDVSPEQAGGVLTSLARAGLVTFRPVREGANPSTLAYWDAAGLDAPTAFGATTTATVGLRVVGGIDADVATTALRAAGLTVADDADRATVGVVLCDDYLNPALADIDAAHRETGVPWLLAKPGGTKTWLGPVFEPAKAGCWHCLARRLWGHRNAERCLQGLMGREGPASSPAAATPASSAMALHLVAAEALKWVSGLRYSGQRSVWTLDTLDLRGAHHDIPVYPQCRSCGDPALVRARSHRPVRLSSRTKVADGGGGHRSMTPEQVRDRYCHLVSPVTGIIKEIKRDLRGPAFFNSYRSGANAAARARDVGTLRAVVRMENGGKGVTPVHAEVSALCEAIERYSGTYHGDEERVSGSLRSLGEQAIHPNECLLYDERQFHGRAEWNATHAPFQHVSAPFDADAVLDWTPVWSMTDERHRLLPTGLLYYGAPGQGFMTADSNGSAAGSSLEDAVLQGLLEVVERDAVALWWYNRTRQPAIDLAAFDDKWTAETRQVHAGLGRAVWALDLTSDIGVPVIVALSRRVDGATEDIMMGFGAHLDPHVALRRALSELNQMMPAVVDARAGEYDSDDPDAVHWWRTATVANQPYLTRDPAVRPRVPEDFGYTPSSDLLTDVTTVRERVEDSGHGVLVLDQTRPDIGLPVVKVIVPGLRHFWSRFAPGRLFDVPVRLGRLAAHTRYEDLNPLPMFL